jgi:GDP-mannose 4,6-dehydratase
MRRVLITGITGFVGSHLCEHILANHPSTEIHGLVRWRSPLDNLSDIDLESVTLEYGDLHDQGSLVRILERAQPNAIFHLAAQSYVQTSFDSPIDTLTTNVLGTANLLEAIRITKTDPVVHICSSSEVYGQVKPEDTPINENCPLRPASPYAVSKVGEDMVAMQYWLSYGIKTIRTRMFTHTGPRRGKVFATSAFARQIALIEAGKQEPVIQVGNLDSVRTFEDVRDAVDAYWKIVTECRPGEVYNIGGDITMTIGEMLDKLISLSRYNGSISTQINKALLRPSDVTLQIPDSSKFREETGWKPKIPFIQTLKDLLDYWRSNV